jgi:geranylgeranyl diphosphate synthase type II
MLSLIEASDLVKEKISCLELKAEPVELYEPIRYIMSLGGKRIRPAIAIMCYSMFKENIEEVIIPSLGLEVFHNFTLVHDDIMDRSDVRRNKPTVHTKWNDNIGILSGDAMLILAYDFVTDCQADQLKPVLSLFGKTAMEVCEGQQLDMNFEDRMDVSEKEYLSMIELKTAVLIAAAFKLGAFLGGAEKNTCEQLYELGRNLGIAFQLQDDYLDSFGDQDTFGKKIGGDIILNKKTYLLIKALQLADGNVKHELVRQLKLKQFDCNKKVEKIQGIYKKLEIDQITQRVIDEYFNRSTTILKEMALKNEYYNKFIELSDFLFRRKK